MQGRLHSTRLLSLYAQMPLGLRAVFGGSTRPFYLLEDVVVDVRTQSMEVGGFVASMRGLRKAIF